jgi:ribosomal protein S18 acetylase RimI-like enzyme
MVTNESRDKILNYLYEDKFLNSYAIYRLQNNISESVTYVKIDENDKIHGYLSKFVAVDAIDVWFRATSSEVAVEFLNLLAKEISDFPKLRGRRRMYISSDNEFAPIIKEKFPCGKFQYENWMMVKKGDEKLSESSIGRRFSEADAKEFAKFWLEDNETLSDEYVEGSRVYIRNGAYYGVFGSEGRLLSSANAMIRLPYVWVITGVETHPEFRRKGYATSIVSKLIGEAFQTTESVALFTNRENAEAINVYEKLGFRKFGELFTEIDNA